MDVYEWFVGCVVADENGSCFEVHYTGDTEPIQFPLTASLEGLPPSRAPQFGRVLCHEINGFPMGPVVEIEDPLPDFLIQKREDHPGFVPWEKDPQYDPKIKEDPRPISPYKGNLFWWDACEQLRALVRRAEPFVDSTRYTQCWIETPCPQEKKLPLRAKPRVRLGPFISVGHRYAYVSFEFSEP